MRYFLLIGIPGGAHPQGEDFQNALKGHLAYLQQGFDSGAILVSGPKKGENASGGIILMKAESEREVDDFIANDPFYQADIERYNVVEFGLNNCQPEVRDWFA